MKYLLLLVLFLTGCPQDITDENTKSYPGTYSEVYTDGEIISIGGHRQFTRVRTPDGWIVYTHRWSVFVPDKENNWELNKTE